MARGPAQYGIKWEKTTPNGYIVRVMRDAELEDVLKTDVDIKRGIYQVVVLAGDEVLEFAHDFNLSSAKARARILVAKYEQLPATGLSAENLEDYL